MDGATAVSGDRVVLTPIDGRTVEVDGRTYAGQITASAAESGLVVVEETTLDRYLYGIAEVPFSWPTESLRAQAIAARTYLAWTLERGRSSNGRRFGYDICATDQCQVYRGLDGVSGVDGARWREAVDSTGALILLDGDRPLQALYSSTSGGRTRSVEDVFGGLPNPHLTAVASPNENSPFAEWRFTIELEEMVALAAAAGLVRGELLDVRTETRSDGAGPWVVDFVGTEGTVSVPSWELRSALNRAARDVLPDVFPVRRPDRPDRRYPQTIMSPSFTIFSAFRYQYDGTGAPWFARYFEVRGNGWGHLVGMSQYGAEAMAAAGETAESIVAHYYGGLRPVSSSDVLPASVRVGLTTSAERVDVAPNGALRVEIDGEVIGESILGSWAFTPDSGGVVITPPVGLGLPPDIGGVRVHVDASERPELISGRLRSAAEVRVTVSVLDTERLVQDWHVREAGSLAFPLSGLDGIDRPIRVTIESRSSTGTAEVTRTVIPQAD